MRKLFSVFSCLGLSVCLGVSLAFCYRISDGFLISMLAFLPGFFFGKIVLGFSMQQGQGLFALDDPRSSELTKVCAAIFKMRPWLVIYLGIVVALASTLVYTSFVMDVFSANDLGESTVRNLKAFSLALATGVALALIHWIACWKDYFYGSEYNARVEFKAKGYDEETTEQKIRQLRTKGVFGEE